jgi:bacillithiol system protein YtxJ
MAFSFFGSSSKSESQARSFWKELKSVTELKQVIEASEESRQVIFKHSTRCIISRTVLRNFEADWDESKHKGDMYFLDLIAHRDVSNAIEELTGVLHQSPQLVVIEGGKAILNRSHQAIRAEEL